MATMIELTDEARKLKLKGFSRLKKQELEKLINDEQRRQENAKLEAIRQAPAPETEKIPFPAVIPTQPLEIDPLEVDDSLIQAVKGKGLTNRERIRRYLAQTPGRKRLSVAQARQVRRNWAAGDNSVPGALIYAGVNVFPYL